MSKIVRFLKDERGSSTLIELAVILPVMIMLFYGFTVFTNILSIDIAIKTAAREGAREYALSGSPSEGKDRALEELLSSGVNGATITSFTEGDARGITVSKKIGVNIPFAGFYGPELEGVGIFVKE